MQLHRPVSTKPTPNPFGQSLRHRERRDHVESRFSKVPSTFWARNCPVAFWARRQILKFKPFE